MRCDGCPVDPGKVCLGETGALPHLCDWAATGEPAMLAAVRGRADFPPPEPPKFTPAPAAPLARRDKPRVALGQSQHG